MPAKARVTREMIVDAAFAIAREAGVENINARTVSERLHCSTQPVMYHFSTIEELKRTVYAKADSYHSEYLMDLKSPQKGVMLGIGMNYIRFAIEEPHLFRFLFQSDYFSGEGGKNMKQSGRKDELLEWLLCPRCGGKTRTQIRTHTVLEDFPLFCPKCKYTCVICFKNGKMEEIKMPDA